MEQFETREMEFRLVDAATREVAGIAVPYDLMERGEMFARGSVTLDPEAKLMWQHDKNEPIGKIVEGRHTDEGFEIRATISDTARGRDAITLLEDGVVNRFSVGFIMRDSTQDENRNRIVTDAYVREVSLVSFPHYEGATVTELRDEPEQDIPVSAEQKGEIMDEIRDLTPELAEVRERIEMVEREISTLGKVEAPSAPSYRSAGHFLQAIVDGDDNAVQVYDRAYTGANTGDSITTPVDVDLIRLVDAANPLGAVFGRGVTPPTGMTITFATVDGITDGTGTQAAEGDDLGYYQLNLDTSTENIITVGNYSELSRQVIDRSSVDYLNSVLRGQAIGLGKALATQLRTKYQAVAAAQVVAGNKVTLAAGTYDGWVGALADASATYFTPNGVQIDALVVDKATFKDLLALDGTPVISFAGEALGAVGSANVSGLRGSIAGIPIVVDAGLDSVNKDECAFVSSLALRQYTSAALRLSGENAVNLSETFSLSTYTATAAEYSAFIIPVDQTP
jgi:HK97 family phage prohead protease